MLPLKPLILKGSYAGNAFSPPQHLLYKINIPIYIPLKISTGGYIYIYFVTYYYYKAFFSIKSITYTGYLKLFVRYRSEKISFKIKRLKGNALCFGTVTAYNLHKS